MIDVVVIGAGAGGLAAAVALGGAGKSVVVVEPQSGPGGKIRSVNVEGIDVDTGPSVLTMPDVLEEVFSKAGTTTSEHLELFKPDPACVYVFPDGTRLPFRREISDTLDEIRKALGRDAAMECERFLNYAEDIWTVAAPNFIFNVAPSLKTAFVAGRKTRGMLKKLDPLRTMKKAIDAQLKNEMLRTIFSRYATYNGSDPRQAPATLNCIAHVEVNLGLFGITGGMEALPKALCAVAKKQGTQFLFGQRVTEIAHQKNKIKAVVLDNGERIECKAVVANADVRHTQKLLGRAEKKQSETSMSGLCAIFRTRKQPDRAAHTLFAIDNYMREFEAIFDQKSVPAEPTVYVSAPRVAHRAQSWDNDEAIFVMANVPAGAVTDGSLLNRCQARLLKEGAIDSDARVLWTRTPQELATTFPDTEGAIYGASSNSMFAAFQRQPNRDKKINGLFYATGSAHPGGGVPLCLRSGLLAARECLEST